MARVDKLKERIEIEKKLRKKKTLFVTNLVMVWQFSFADVFLT